MMRAMVLESAKSQLIEKNLPRPKPRQGQILVQVCACAVSSRVISMRYGPKAGYGVNTP